MRSRVLLSPLLTQKVASWRKRFSGSCSRATSRSFPHLTADKVFADVYALRLQISINLPQDLVVTGLVGIGCNHFLGIGFDRGAVAAQFFSTSNAEQFVATRLHLEV